MSRRNIANYTTFNTILVNNLEIQNSGVGLSIYDNDPNNPVFSFNPGAKTFDMTGVLNVVGDASFETITVSEFEGGMQFLASTNPGDTWDIGINAGYNDGSFKYTGIIRDASDSLKRWTFFKDITTLPTTTVAGIDSTKLDSVRMDTLYVNDGSVSLPSITFHNDTGTNTGFYLAAQNEIGITTGGTKIAGMRYVSGTSTEMELNTNTTLKLLKLDTVDNATSVDMPSITIGHINLQSSSANDKWFKYYSATTAGTPSYSGSVFTSPSDHYFVTNTGGVLLFARGTDVVSSDSCPDYRDSTTVELFKINGTTSTETKLPLIVPLGSLGNLAIKFSSENTTGFYRSGINSIGIICAGSNIINVAPTEITFTQELYNINGSLSSPAIAFTANTDVGLFRDTGLGRENITVTIDGTDSGKFTLNTTIPQFIMPLGGTASIPSYTFTDIDTGFYAPTEESTDGQIALTLGGLETIRFRRRTGTVSQGLGNIEVYNSIMFTPNSNTQVAAIYNNDTRINNTLKGYKASFQAYNLIDESLLVLYTFRSTGSIGQDYSDNNINATVVGSPTIKTTERDANSVLKRDVLDFTANTSSTQYLNLTSNLSSFTSIDQASISFWFKISGSLANDNTILDCYKTSGAKHLSIKILSDSATYPNALQVTVECDSLITLQYHTATLADSGTPSPVSIKDGLWHHVVIHLGTSSGPVTKHIMYLDNVELNKASNKIYYTFTGDNSGQPELSTNSFNDLSFNYIAIGAFFNGTSGSLGYTGYLKDFYLTRRLLSSSEINNLYNEPTVYAYSLDVAKINASDFNIMNQGFFSDGSVSSPSITFASDTDTGLYRSSANTIGFSTSGIARMTISDSILEYNSNAFELDVTKRWLRLKMSSGTFGSRLVFCATGTPAQHSIRALHQGSIIDGNYLDFYLFDTGATDSDGLGNNQVMRLAVSAASANSAIQTVYGVSRVHNGSVSAPAYSFSNSTGLGLYRITSDDLGIAAAGTLRLEVNTVVTIGNASNDTTTRLYVPLGSQALPGYSFIGDTNTGIFSSTADNLDITCGNTLISNFSTSGLLNQTPIIVDVNSTSAFIVRQDGAPSGGNVFTVDTTNSRVGIGYNSLYIYKQDSFNSTAFQRIGITSSTVLTGTIGLVILNTLSTTTNSSIAEITIGKSLSFKNSASMSFHYVADGDNNNKFEFGFNGVTGDQFNIKADGSTNVTGSFTVSSTSTFSDQIKASDGTVSLPAYTFASDNTTGIYRLSNGNIGLVKGASLNLQISSSAVTSFAILAISSGNFGAPGLVFNAYQTTGIYNTGVNVIGISNAATSTWLFSPRGTAPHECLNEIYFKPDGSNIRTYIQDKKIRLSSNQTILNILPVIHYKFTTAPATNTSIQDESINKYVIEATTASYVTSTVSLTDANGDGLLQYGAVQFTTTGTDRIETNTIATELTYLSDYRIGIKFKATDITSGSLFEIYGNRDGSIASNYIRASVVSGNLNILIHNGTTTTLNASSTSVPFTTNIWYNLVLTLTSSGNSVTVNGTALTLSYATGTSSITITPAGFGSTANLTVIVGGATASILAYIAEFFIVPTTTTETANILYRTQAHEVYTNKLQIAGTNQGLVDEGFILRSDKGNNAVWDNSLQINAGYIQFNSSKVLRLPDGSASLPALSFISDTNTGIYSGGSDILAISTGGTQRATISSTQISTASSVNVMINNTTIPSNSSTGALVVAGGIGVGNDSSTPGVINFGSVYSFTNSSKLISLYDTANNTFQFYGFGIQTNILSYTTDQTGSDHVFYCGTSSTSRNELFRIKGTGVVQAQNGTVSAPSYSFLNSTATGFYRIAADNIGFAAAGAKTIDLSSSTTQVVNDFQTISGFRKNFTVVATTTLTLDTTHCIVELSYADDATNVVITLPEAITLNRGREYTLIKTGNGGGNLLINTFDSNDFIDDNSTTQITLSTQFDRVTLVCNGVNRWYTM